MCYVIKFPSVESMREKKPAKNYKYSTRSFRFVVNAKLRIGL